MAPQQATPPAVITWDNVPTDDGTVGVALDGRLIFSFFESSLGTSFSCTVSNSVSGQSTASSRYLMFDPTQIDSGKCGHLVSVERSSDYVIPAESAALVHSTLIVIPPVAEQTLVAGETLILECFTSGR